MQPVLNYDIKLFRWAQTLDGEPFEWGRTDCGSLVRHAAELMHDRTPLCCLPDWDDRRSALRTLSDIGTVRDKLKLAPADPVEPGYARTGDVMLYDGGHETMPAMGVVVQNQVLVADEDEGVRLVDVTDVPNPEVWRYRHG